MKAVKLAVVASLVGSVALAVIFSGRFGEDPTLVPSPLLGQPAPTLQLPRLDGSGTFDLASLEGRVVVLNFFASWCLPCRAEQKELTAIADSFASRGVTVVEIAYQDTPTDALDFLAETGSSPAAVYLADPGGRAAIAFGVFGIPETFFIDGDGIVVGKVIGPTDALVLGSAVDAVLAGQRPGQQVTGETQNAPG